MAKLLGGSMFVHNAVKFDYCVAEALHSLCELCDEAVVMDCESDDNTLDVLHDVARTRSNLKVISGAKWEVGKNYDRLAILADRAKSHLSTPWHFMLQADEVIHESSFNVVRRIITTPRYKSYSVRRFNLYGDLNHCFKLDMPNHRKPCNDHPLRLALREAKALADAESLEDLGSHSEGHIHQIVLFHYGLVRRDMGLIDKTIDMQSWFHGPGSQPDQRVVEMKNTDGVFDWERIVEREFLMRLPMAHPRFSAQWAAERQAEKKPVVLENTSSDAT